MVWMLFLPQQLRHFRAVEPMATMPFEMEAGAMASCGFEELLSQLPPRRRAAFDHRPTKPVFQPASSLANVGIGEREPGASK